MNERGERQIITRQNIDKYARNYGIDLHRVLLDYLNSPLRMATQVGKKLDTGSEAQTPFLRLQDT